jgi:hypothetical protein
MNPNFYNRFTSGSRLVTSELLERRINMTALREPNHLVYWLAALLLLCGFGFGDLAVVAWSASLVGFWQLAGSALSFALIGAGVLFTAWRMGAVKGTGRTARRFHRTVSQRD